MNYITAMRWTITALLVAMVSAATIERGEPETGALQLAKEQYDGLLNCDQHLLEVEKKDEHLYSAVRLVSYDIIIKPPTDCWWRFRLFMALHAANFKEIANKYCRNYIGCWCCPGGGLCVTFVVKPDFWRCFVWQPPIFKEKIPIFEPELDIRAL